MSKKIIGNESDSLDNKVIASREIMYSMNMLILQKYGMNNYGSGEYPLEFHNFDHSVTVSAAADLIYMEALKRGKLHKYDLIYLRLACNGHDIEQNAKNENGRATWASKEILKRHDIEESLVSNELISALLTREMMMAKKAFSEHEICLVENLILATRPYFEDGKFCQTAKNGTYLEKVIADADLAHLGFCTRSFEASFKRYIDESYKNKPKPKSWILFNEEADFLEDHEYLTDEAKEIFNNKQANLEFCRNKINQCHRYL
ncbi:MAG: hypothetical protein NTY12_02340 [Candidatus Falkowbacteria bacterium]|nr:hypothetical protein [Candidatus Falkowbacteria bacterium]